MIPGFSLGTISDEVVLATGASELVEAKRAATAAYWGAEAAFLNGRRSDIAPGA